MSDTLELTLPADHRQRLAVRRWAAALGIALDILDAPVAATRAHPRAIPEELRYPWTCKKGGHVINGPEGEHTVKSPKRTYRECKTCRDERDRPGRAEARARLAAKRAAA